MTISYGVFDALPITAKDADAAGYAKAGDCVDGLGVEMIFGYKGAGGQAPRYQRHHPVSLFFTASTGQLSGMRVNVQSAPPAKLVSAGYWRVPATAEENVAAYITVGFRDPALTCGPGGGGGGGEMSALKLGDRVVINPDAARQFPVPVTPSDAAAAKYNNGSCISKMGFHAEYDIETAPVISWKAENLQPVVPMYWLGQIYAIFFTVPHMEQSVFPPNNNQWDIVPLPNFGMCKNFCQTSPPCKWTGSTGFFSTMHVFFNNYESVKCDGHFETCNRF